MGRLALPYAEGVFTMTGLATGSYILNVGASIAEANSPGNFYRNVMRASRIDQMVEATVTAGQTTVVSIDTDVAWSHPPEGLPAQSPHRTHTVAPASGRPFSTPHRPLHGSWKHPGCTARLDFAAKLPD